MDEKKRAIQEKIEAELSNWNPKEYSGEEITSDPFKTIFVGSLSYSVTEHVYLIFVLFFSCFYGWRWNEN